jgi:hypothetical protein
LLAAFLGAASIIAVGDAVIVTRNGGTPAAATTIHNATAAVAVIPSAALIIA